MNIFISKKTPFRVVIIFILLHNINVGASDSSEICPEPVYKSDQHHCTFVRASATSSYLTPKDVFRTTPKEAVAICEQMGLQSAVILNNKDYWDIVNNIVMGKFQRFTAKIDFMKKKLTVLNFCENQEEN